MARKQINKVCVNAVKCQCMHECESRKKDCNMSRVIRKPVFGVSDQDRHKPGCTITEEASNVGFRKKRHCTIFVAKALISYAVTLRFRIYAKISFSHDATYILVTAALYMCV